jgi:hypothetical protein
MGRTPKCRSVRTSGCYMPIKTLVHTYSKSSLLIRTRGDLRCIYTYCMYMPTATATRDGRRHRPQAHSQPRIFFGRLSPPCEVDGHWMQALWQEQDDEHRTGTFFFSLSLLFISFSSINKLCANCDPSWLPQPPTSGILCIICATTFFLSFFASSKE